MGGRRLSGTMFDLILGGGTAALLAVYLIAALLWPQRF
jgi:K+-transporting ATPase KdpF subunit